MRLDVLEELPRRLGYVFASGPERARPDGYWDYEAEHPDLARGTLRARLDDRSGEGAPSNGTGRFPGAEALRDLAATLPAAIALVIVFPPNYVAFQPSRNAGRRRRRGLQGGPPRRRGVACSRGVIDWRVDRPENRDPALYFDETHYRHPIAERVENEIAAALRRRP